MIDSAKMLHPLLRGGLIGALQIATGFAKIEDFVSHFIQIEELNFHRFQYMHSLNLDIDKMEDEIKNLHVEAEQAMAENKGNNDHWQQHQHAEEAKVRWFLLLCLFLACIHIFYRASLLFAGLSVNTCIPSPPAPELPDGLAPPWCCVLSPPPLLPGVQVDGAGPAAGGADPAGAGPDRAAVPHLVEHLPSRGH